MLRQIWDMRNLGRAKRAAKPDEGAIGSSTMPATASSNDGTGTVDGPAETISVSGECWCDEPWHSQGEYLYAARLLPSRAVVAGGSGFQEVRVVGRDTLLVSTAGCVQCAVSKGVHQH